MAFNSEQQYAVLKKVGYTGPLDRVSMEDFMGSRPGAASLVLKLEKKAQEMKSLNEGGVVSGLSSGGYMDYRKAKQRYNAGLTNSTGERIYQGEEAYRGRSDRGRSAPPNVQQQVDMSPSTPPQDPTDFENGGTVSDTGNIFKGTVAAPVSSFLAPEPGQDIRGDFSSTADSVGPTETVGVDNVASATSTKEDAAKYDTATTKSAVDTALDGTPDTKGLEASQGEVSDKAKVTAAQQEDSSVSGLKSAQGEAILMTNPVQREIEEGELISGVANAEKAAKFTEEVEAATATPTEKATVQGQLSDLMQDFEGGDTPAWASGAMRAATAAMAQRGLGSSSMAGQALVQAAMESALPIAMADAQTQASFETQNLSNRQQRAMLGAQQRAAFIGQEFDQAFQARVQNASKISDVANMNFTAEQQIALENSRNANTINMANLSNDQALVMAEAAALSNMDMANLNNRQQAAVQNSQSFLQMDMANLTNKQQTNMFKAQARQQSILTDAAARNASSQFNATSENQTNQFFADLSANVSKFNTDQKNGIAKFDANAVNATRQFNTAQNNSFKQFNTSNSLVVAQANAQWRQNISTTNNATANERAMYVAKERNKLSTAALDEIWQRERDVIDYAFTAYESDQDRSNAIVLEKLTANNTLDAAKFKAELDADSKIASWILDGILNSKGNIFNRD